MLLKDYAAGGLFAFLPVLAFLLLGELQTGNVSDSNVRMPGDAAYILSLVQSHECEAPVLRSRLGQQLQLNARTLRSNYQQRIQRSTDSSGFLPPEMCSLPFLNRQNESHRVCPSSSYEVYSIFTSPVRAGPFSIIA